MTMTDQSAVHSLISHLVSEADDDAAFIVAATFNLYTEALRRISGRVLLGPADIKLALTICDHLLTPKPIEASVANGRSRELSKEESEELLSMIERREPK